ncbi:MAG: hypothetical protein R3248_01225 [Candidatus Promineifilaceae bacterium]|nr:hypothetical protein [Candidatus Promineifilaceae bacterium]
MKDKKRTAEELEKYIDRPDSYASELDPALERVVDSLRHAASQSHPRPGFANELAQRLKEKEQTMSEKRFRPQWWQVLRRVAAGGVAVAALLALVLVAFGLFGGLEPEPAALDQEAETVTSFETVTATDGNFAGTEFVLATELSDEPEEAPLLTVLDVRLPRADGGQSALAAARNFGIADGTLYEAPNDPNGWIVMAEDGRNIVYRESDRPDGPIADLIYYNNPQAQRETGEPLPYAEAVQTAREFLQLPDDYEAAPEQMVPSSSVRTVHFYKVFEGHPIVGTEAAAEIAVSPGGQVAYARLMPVGVAPAGDPVRIKSDRQALDDLIHGESGYSFSYTYTASDPVQYFTPPPPEWEVGDAVTVDGWVNVLLPVNGGEPRVELRARDGATYLLTGPTVAELVDHSGGQIRVSGTVAEQKGPARWDLALASWEPLPPSEGQSGACHIGVFRRDVDAATLETDEGETYQLAYAPPELNGGERVEVCAEAFPAGDPVEWVRMASPPASEGGHSGSGGGGSGSVGVAETVVEAVAVTRTVTSSAGDGREVTESVVESVAGGEEGAAPASPYDLGEQVRVTGSLAGSIRVDGDRRDPQLVLLVDADEDPLTPAVAFPLTGDEALLEEMAEHYRLHLAVDGVVVAADPEPGGPDGQAIRVESFERVWPEQRLEAFLGRVQTETLEEREVVVFIDEETGQRYVLTTHYPGPEGEEQRWFVTGVVHPEETFAGLPLLEPAGISSGSNVDAAESAAELPLDKEIPVYNAGAVSGPPWMQGTLVIDDVVLGYQYRSVPGPDGDGEPRQLKPAWIFYGHNEDGTISFTIVVDATRSENGGS